VSTVKESCHAQDGLQIVPHYSLRSKHRPDCIPHVLMPPCEMPGKVMEFDEDWTVATLIRDMLHLQGGPIKTVHF